MKKIKEFFNEEGKFNVKDALVLTIIVLIYSILYLPLYLLVFLLLLEQYYLYLN